MGVACGGEQTISFLESSASLLSLGGVESLMKGVMSWEDNSAEMTFLEIILKQYPVLWDAPLRSRIYGALPALSLGLTCMSSPGPLQSDQPPPDLVSIA